VSTNGGDLFTSIAGSLPVISARSIVMDKDDLNEGLYVGMNTGVYYKDNTMPDWVPFLTGLPLVAVNELDIQQATRKIRVGTYGRGLWETDLNTNNPIPVRWISFTGKRTNSGNQLTWKAEEDANTDSYELEYSPNGIRYNTVKTIVAQSKLQNSSGLTATYTEADSEKNDAYYRLKQFDRNGRFSYSEVVFIKGGQNKQLLLYPNPVKDQLRLSIPGVLGNEQAIVQIYQVNGIKLLEQRVATNTASINTERFSTGQYIVRVMANGQVYQQLFNKAE
jgi:Secretion system C-terminal sorting domain